MKFKNGQKQLKGIKVRRVFILGCKGGYCLKKENLLG